MPSIKDLIAHIHAGSLKQENTELMMLVNANQPCATWCSNGMYLTENYNDLLAIECYFMGKFERCIAEENHIHGAYTLTIRERSEYPCRTRRASST